MKLAQVKLRFGTSDKLVDVDAVKRHHQRKTVRLGYFVDMIGGDHRPRARHILRDDLRLTGNMFAHESGEQPPPAVIKSTRRIADNETDCFALVKSLALRAMRALRMILSAIKYQLATDITSNSDRTTIPTTSLCARNDATP